MIAPMVLGSVLNPVNSSMIAVALVPIGSALGAPPSQTAWLVSGLYLATAVGQPVIGRLVDMFGPRRLYLIGTAMVGVAGLLGSVAPNLGAMAASAADAAFFQHGADTGGLHHLSLFMLAGAVLLLAVTVIDRSLGTLTPRKA
ncbi:MFS transporter [Streptomyces sp. SAS_275]